ncbi:Crp/Fnr family transcriptional regulator [Pedobacter sp. PLR]|uniref:Crp/Fnr family transcriptional regulator n=1 Tax=Pedobacter sp. PLR TaxID=2994465 RepID=UPI0022457FD4|nr:Crp/Fnr family transcriptional regulator [Pedobacter sp. PLR]MCX2454098.1 Crp/Fnr family transcriptional regulator [Pedobacter sp. PLR]
MDKRALYFYEMMYGKESFPKIDLTTVDAFLKQMVIPPSRQELRKKIGSLCPVSDQTFHLFNYGFQPFSLPQDQLFCSAEQIPNKILFVQHGLLRGYYKGEKQQVTTWFAGPNEFIIPNNFISQAPCQEYIECLENSSFLALDYQTWLKIYIASNEIAKLFLKLMEEKQLQTNAREKMLRVQNAERRFQHLTKEIPGLLQNVKDDLLASYLNVTRRHLERIKVQCFKKPSSES